MAYHDPEPRLRTDLDTVEETEVVADSAGVDDYRRTTANRARRAVERIEQELNLLRDRVALLQSDIETGERRLIGLRAFADFLST